MARYHVNQISEFPFHITGRCPNKESFRIDLADVWSIMEDYLFQAHHVYGLKIHSFVLMPNHFHLLASSTGEIGKVMCEFMKNTSKELNFQSGRINQNWGGRHYKCEITSPHYFTNVYKYVYQNPIRCGLSQYAEGWKYSTLHRICGLDRLIIPLEPDQFLFNPGFDDKVLQWLNKPISSEHYNSIKSGLKHKKFKLPKSHGWAHQLETELI